MSHIRSGQAEGCAVWSPKALDSVPAPAYDCGMNNDLDLEIAKLAGPGRRPAPLEFAIVRPLRVSDLMLLAVPAAIQPIPIKKLSERHHALARMLAVGVAPFEAAAITGYELSRVSVLQGDPTFCELVSFYREKVDAEFADTMGQLSGLSKDILIELRTRLEDEPEKFKIGELQSLLTATLDRSGYGPTTKQETTTINLSGRLDEARRRAQEARRQAIIDVTPMRDVTPQEAAE